MRAPRAPAALLCAAALAGAAACGGASDGPAPEPSEPAPSSTGYFTGKDADGLGAAVDLLGNDPVSRAVVAALSDPRRDDAPVVGIASLVNSGQAAVPAPAFVAMLESGGAVPLEPAIRAIAGRHDPEAVRARNALGRLRRIVPAAGGVVTYLVLRGAGAREVASVRMVTAPGEGATLGPRKR
jgi:hypothetical protein